MPDPLQIVAFDVPYPPNYGGAIDVFYRLRALSEQGVPLHLHAFTYRDRLPTPELREYCEAVYYYRRPRHFSDFFHRLPYIVASRMLPELLDRLAHIPYPILFEGVHTCGFIGHKKLEHHTKLVRMHNVEQHYYRHLAGLENNPIRRWHFRQEARKLTAFEANLLPHVQHILAISTRDEKHYLAKGVETTLLPAFHGQKKVSSLAGRGAYVLFHGNLSVRDNEKAALFLIRQVLTKPFPPLVIAGRHASSRLRTACARHPHVMLAEDPDEEEMADLIRQAHINLLYTFQPDGIKIKLLRALYQGRHVIANSMMVDGTGLESLCQIADTPETLAALVHQWLSRPFTAKAIDHRQRLLEQSYSDRVGARTLVQLAER